MENNWVDFKTVKAAVTMQMVFGHYQINWLKKSGEELRGRCPIHQGEGKDTFRANLTKNAFNCFSCKAHGNVLDFVAAMEKCSVRDAAVKLKEWFVLSEEAQPAEKQTVAVGDSAPVTNETLGFALKSVAHEHGYLAQRGISKELAEGFGIGFYSGKGSMTGRIVIPIHNAQGGLVAYAGRAIDDGEPKYKLPAGFHKSLELYNLHRSLEEKNPEGRVVVVEGFFDCLRVFAAGFPCVSLMGSSMSDAQEELIAKHFKSVWLMLDGDEAGKQGTADCLTRLSRRMLVRVAEVPNGKQPDQLSTSEMRELLGGQ